VTYDILADNGDLGVDRTKVRAEVARIIKESGARLETELDALIDEVARYEHNRGFFYGWEQAG
jgi:hypothetical protein